MPCPGPNAAVSVERFFELSILGLVASGFLAVAGSGYLDLPTMALTSLGFLLRALLILGLVRFRVSERFLTVATLAYAGFFLLDYLFISHGLLDSTVHLVFFLAVMKILSATTHRDFLFTATLAFMELIAAAILSANLNFFLFLALYLFFAMAAFTSSEIRRAIEKPQQVARSGLRRFHPRLGALTAFATAGILSLTAGLFFMLPRTANAAFRHLISHRIFLPGFSNQVMLGQIGQIKTSSRPVMHIRIDTPDAPRNLKWRGAALSEFDGRRWFNSTGQALPVPVEDGRAVLASEAERGRPGKRIQYRIDLTNLETEALFFAGRPENISTLGFTMFVLFRDGNSGFRLAHVPPEGFQYDAYSLVETPLTETEAGFPDPSDALPPEVRRKYLQLPSGLDPRVSDLAHRMAAGEISTAGRARAIERHLRTEYGYTLDLLQHNVRDPLTYFLFARKKGHCEYFASAMTVMLRTMGIPARLATGFQSGTFNPLTELYLVRASDAHSWVEAYLPRRGWTTFDPTPPDPGRRASIWDKLALYADAADTFWQEWVLAYNPMLQLTLAENMERSSRSLGLRWIDRVAVDVAGWKNNVIAFFRRAGAWLLFACALLTIGIWLAPGAWRRIRMLLRVRQARRGQARVDDATLLYGRMLDLLKRRGFQKPAWFTPHEFAVSLPRSELGALVAQFTEAYNALRFGGKISAAPGLSTLLDRLEALR